MADQQQDQQQNQPNVSTTPSTAVVGMNLDSTARQIRPGQLIYALNATNEGFDGNSTTYQNEQANIKCCDFPVGFRVIGVKNIIEDNLIVVWLANPDTADSEIGTIQNCTYTKFINDPCLGHDIRYPILEAVVKRTNCTLEIYYTDGFNGRRFFDLKNPPYKEDVSKCPPGTTFTVDCNKMAIQPLFSIPSIQITSVESDGLLTAGTYQFAVQYCNVLGEGYTSYYSVTNPLPIFDPNKVTQDFNYTVGKSINFTISDIDTTGFFDFINIAVIKTVNDIPSVELLGTFQINGSSKDINYTGQSKTDIRLGIGDIFEKFPIYDTAQDVTSSQDILIWSNLTTQERISYQWIANRVNIQWQTWRLRDDKPYADELNATYRRGYMRDEVYAFEVCFLLDNGYQTDGFHIPGRVSTETDNEIVYNQDVIGTSDPCGDQGEKTPPFRWQVYNTGYVEAFDDEYLLNANNDCYEGPYQYGQMAYWQSTDTYPCNPDIYEGLSSLPIRHHKFPDSVVTHIHDDKGFIYPIGIKIDLAQIYNLIQQSPLTDKQKSKIKGIKILRGNRAANKSVIAKGLIHNVGLYEKSGTSYFYPNYPYNDLRPDPFISITATGDDSGTNSNSRLNGFTSDDSKRRFVFHSADTHFYQPALGNVLKLETAEFGVSNGHFVEVKNHAKYKFLTSAAYETAIVISLAIGVLGSATLTGNISDSSAVVASYQLFIDIIERIAPRSNFCYQYDSKGFYNSFVPVANDTGNKIRQTDIAGYLISGLQALGDTHNINNYQRESSVYVRATNSLPFVSEIPGVPEDISRVINSQEDCTSPDKIFNRDISSYYASIKVPHVDQYGPLYTYETIDTGYQEFFTDLRSIYILPKRNIFGGDIFINKFAYKSKLPFFTDNRVNFPNDADIEYNLLSNIANTIFWFSTGYNDGGGGGLIRFFKQLLGVKINNFDCPHNTAFWQQGKIYLFAYGAVQFYGESEVNVDLRQAFNGREGDFFPHVSGEIPDDWFQEINVPIVQDNTYWYNRSFSKQNKENFFAHLPDDFKVEQCLQTLPFRAIYSEKQEDVINYKRNNWLIYRPAAKYDFPQNYGRLYALEGIESRQLLARFENKSLLYNALLTAPTSAADVYLGQTFLSQQTPPLDFAETDIGYAGTQNKFFLKTEYGHISADAKRGQVFLFSLGTYGISGQYGRQAREITNEGVNKFFTQYLGFEITKYFPNVNTDNHFNGVGLHGVFDSKYNRFILTKLDYIPIKDGIIEKDGFFYYNGDKIELTNQTYFCNNSFTISYDFDNKSWVSFHSYLPNYYVGEANFFYSGINVDGQSSIWRHNTEQTRYNNFYGQIHPYIIEYPYSYQFNDELLQSIKDYTKVIQHIDWQSFVETDDIWFNKMILSNNQQSSGILELVPKPKNSLAQYANYPIYGPTSKVVTFTKRDNLYQVDTFWSVTKNSQAPIWKKSCQSLSIFKELDQTNCDYGKRSFRKAPLRAKDLKVRMILDNRDDVRMISQFSVIDSQKSYL